MQLNSIAIGRTSIVFVCILNPNPDNESNSMEERKTTAHEEPLPELKAAFSACASVICRSLEHAKKWAVGVVVTKLAVSYTKAGTRSVKFTFTKVLDSSGTTKVHQMDTPWMRIEKPVDGESGMMEVTGDEQELILEAIHEATRYAKGERSQQLLQLEDATKGINALAEKGRQLDLV